MMNRPRRLRVRFCLILRNPALAQIAGVAKTIKHSHTLSPDMGTHLGSYQTYPFSR